MTKTTDSAAQPLAAHVAEFATGTRYEDIPADAIRIAKLHILDSIAVGLAGAPAEGSEIVRRYIESIGCRDGAATIFGTAQRAIPRFAALANASAMHADDYDDTYHPSRFHPSAPVLSAAMAEAEQIGASGKAVLAAFAIGTEVSLKLSHTIGKQHYARGFHMTSTCGVFGATAGACRVRGLSSEATLRAIGIAGSESAGVRENFGTMVKPFHSGRAAENAIVAASLAEMGFTSSPTILEGNRGYFMTGAGEYNADELVGKLGNPWNYVAKRVAIKPYPCGNLQQPAMDALLDLVTKNDIRPEQVKHLAIKSHRLMPLNLTYHRPTTGLEGKFSMEFSLASILVLRKAGLAEYSDEVVNRPDVQAAIRRMDYTVFSDEEGEANGWHLWTTFLDLTLTDGRTFSVRADYAKGSAAMPMNEGEVSEKYRDCAAFAGMPKAATEKSIELILGLEKVCDIRELTALLRKDA
jgi:2-methylcitrate dehydratase PrpD